jgi:hypothetical protein
MIGFIGTSSTVTVNYSHTELLLNVCLTNLYGESLTHLSLMSDCFISEAESELLYNWLFTANQFVLPQAP